MIEMLLLCKFFLSIEVGNDSRVADIRLRWFPLGFLKLSSSILGKMWDTNTSISRSLHSQQEPVVLRAQPLSTQFLHISWTT